MSPFLVLSVTNLFASDIDGNIARCHLRIEENILPTMFQARLERYMERKAEREYVETTILS